jgi:tRNA A-37 threonylcarbamoyl transferase component Bud32
MELTVPNVYGLLLRSRLLPLEDARALYVRWQQEAGENVASLARFTSWLVAKQYLTEYQAGLLAKGHADGFFLNDYTILERLGKGRMAGVYKARHKLGQIVAIKVLPPSKAREPNLLARFHRESRLALCLKHPNVVRAFQTGLAGDLHYLVMEYLEGETLDEVLQRRGKLQPAEAVRLVYQALQGLEHIRAQGMVHRDVKPANLMLVGSQPDSTLKATVKILDIGLGRALFEEGQVEGPEAGLTSEGVLLGTPDYMAPEQARDPRQADIRADIYSVGCVLYHLLSGQPPFPDTNVLSQMVRHATMPARPLRDFNPAVPDGLQQIVNWMLAKDPVQRYPTPERAAGALQVFLTAGPEPAAAPEADPHMKPYLRWLEGQGIAAGSPPVATPVAPSAPGGTIPAGLPVVAPAAPSASPARTDSRRRKRHKKRHEAASPPTVPFSVPPAAPEPAVQQIDVEPVELPQLEPPGRKLLGMHLSRRDFAAFGIGALAGSAVTFLGCYFALQLGKNRNEPPPESSPANPGGRP